MLGFRESVRAVQTLPNATSHQDSSLNKRGHGGGSILPASRPYPIRWVRGLQSQKQSEENQ